MLDHALAYAAAGWPVFPCDPRQDAPGAKKKRSKAPLVAGPDLDEAGNKIPQTGGLYRASRDAMQIGGWWRQYPKALIGVPTGRAAAAFVIDLDPRDGETLDQVEGRLIEAVGPLPRCPRSVTQSGGAHLWFAMPETGEIPKNSAKRIKGVDWRGDGGYVIVPPSVMADGAAYEWIVSPDELELPQAPPPLLDLVFKRGKFAPPGRGGTVDAASGLGSTAPVAVRDERVRKWALSALDAELSAFSRAFKGSRGFELNRVGFVLGQLVGAGALAEATVAAGLEQAAASNGLAEADGWPSVRRNITRSVRDGMASPRDLSDVGTGPTRQERPPPPDEPPGPAAPDGGSEHARGKRRSSGGGDGGGKPPSGDDAGDGADEPDPEATARCAAEPQNDTGNARRLIAHFGHDMLRVRDVGPHFWAGSHWDPQGGAEAFQRFAQRTAEYIAYEALHIEPGKADRAILEAAEPVMGMPFEGLDDTEKALLKAGQEAEARLKKRRADRRKFAISCGNSNRIAGMIAQAAPHMTVAPDELDADPLAVNLINGTLRIVREKRVVAFAGDDPGNPLADGERVLWRARLDAHARADRIAKVMPVSWDPDAKAPKWCAFMERFMPNPAIRGFLQRYHGYALTGLTGEQIFVFNYGLGANGKSTFMETLRRLQGDYAKVLQAESLTGDSHRRGDQATPEFARLPGARLVVCAELPRGQGFRESTLKMLTGGEAMLVRHLHEGFFEFQPTFKPVGSGNDRPAIGGVDEGIWRRMKLVPWEVRIPAEERRPMEKVLAEFAEEAPGILNWLVEGLLDYLDNGLRVPAEIDAATESYRGDMDPVGEFTRACIEGAPGEHVTAREMYQAYTAWCHANSVKPYSEKGFAGIMVQKGFEREVGRIRKYLNVRLRDVPADPEAQTEYPAGYGYGYGGGDD